MSQLRPRSTVGGMGRVAWGASEALLARGHSVHFAGPPAGGEPEEVAGIELHPWPAQRLGRLRALVELGRRIRPDIVHFHSALPHGELIGPYSVLRGRRGPRIVVTPYTSARASYPRWRARLGLRRADAVITSSYWSAENAIRAGADAATTWVVHAGIEPVTAVAGPRAPVVVSLGRLKKVKGMDVLIDAFDRAAKGRSDWVLRIAGEGEERPALEAQIAGARHGDRMELLGGVYADVKARLLGEASIGVVPSLAENFPGALLELQAHGLACIGTEVGGIPELARGGAARLVPPGQIEPLALELGRLMDDAGRRRELADAALALARELDWETVGARFARVYQSILKARRSGSA
jgi:glycosyltransferase involved in cell wall biosynthesis